MRILGIETSADDTGVALIETNGSFGEDFSFKILGNALASQTAIHQEYGGIYPNLAKREHGKNLPVVFEKVFKGTGEKPDAIAVTVGPGLEPCLWTGINFAQKLSAEWNVPVVPVNHMEGHILISLMQREEADSEQETGGSKKQEKTPASCKLHPVSWPALALLVSGGHTELILIRNLGSYEYIGRTRDDAVGEAFDKVARLLGLTYPGGPEISRLAEVARTENLKTDFSLPRPMMHGDTYDFSFSGLKTAVLRHIEKNPLQSLDRERIAREFEDTVTEVLLYKTLRAVEEYLPAQAGGASTVVMGGGVSANKHIREELRSKLQAASCELLVCPPEFSTDNGLMIALAGAFRASIDEYEKPKKLTANGNLKLC